MNKSRLEAFSDGVLAIIITIMVLEIKPPHSAEWASLQPLIPVFLSYIISFLLVGIYWGNHHHLLHTVKYITSGIILSNLNLLFWLSLVPVATAWMGENHFAPNTIISYAVLLIICGISYGILKKYIVQTLKNETEVLAAIKKQDRKVFLGVIFVLSAIPLAYVHPALSGLVFLLQSAIWLVPDKNIEKALRN